MKKLLLLINMLLLGFVSNAQVLFSDNFDGYTVGALGTDLSGVVPGQGGWFTKKAFPKSDELVGAFNVVAEAGRGKILQFTNSNLNSAVHYVNAYRSNTDVLINQRTVGNNVIMVQFDMFLEHSNDPNHFIYVFLNTNEDSLQVDKTLFKFQYRLYNGEFNMQMKYNPNLHNPLFHIQARPSVPINTWVTFKIYLDYNNRKIYLEVPYNNKVYSSDFLKDAVATNLIESYKPKFFGCGANFSYYAYEPKPYPKVNGYLDNISLTALYSVPPHVLSAATFLNDKFNIYPNPASNLVTITSNDNLPVQQVTIYDIAGKQLSTQTFNNQNEIQLNVENLANGTYMLHIQTKEGTAVKQLVKK